MIVALMIVARGRAAALRRAAARCLGPGLGGALAALILAGCTAGRVEDRGPLPATRGYVLISIDALGAAHLGAYGARRDTSPFFDSLAQRGVLFEHAVVQYPSTLTSHLSLFTGLYPGEHGVYPPAGVLPEAVTTLPERFRAAGFRTAGHTEGGFMAGGFGFARGFEEFTDSAHTAERDVERTFRRGLEFLSRLRPDERFFLFLHTYAVHDPYDPPTEQRALFWNGEAPVGPPPTGPELRRLNAAGRPPEPRLAAYYEALYSASVRYTDGVLADFFSELEKLGLVEETTVVITSDHGEEFGEHGRLGHTQLYPELLFVPLLVLHPEAAAGGRVSGLVESIDVAPTLIEIAGLDPFGEVSGRSLAAALRDPERLRHGEAYAEMLEERRHRTLLRQEDGTLVQLLADEPHADPEGVWIERSVTFDCSAERLVLSARSFHRPRHLVLSAAGRRLAEAEIGTSWESRELELVTGGTVARLRLETDGCDSPKRLELSADERCLSVQVRSPPLWITRLYDLTADPLAATDLRRRRPELYRRLARRLRELEFDAVAAVEQRQLPRETLETLRALGYVD